LIVLSLFDGMSCGQIALERTGIKVDKYYASEIDKYAIQITQKNYPGTIQLGNVNNDDWQNIEKINLLLGGSPCQDLSIAKKNREGLKGKKSSLFFKYVEALETLKPKYFLYENVASMKKNDRDIISSHLGVEPILINSSLVSAQNRRRLYWTNISNIAQPADKHIYLKDVLESGVVDRDKSYCIDANYYKGSNLEQYIIKGRRQIVFTERRTQEAKQIRKEYLQKYGKDFCPRRSKELVPRTDGKVNCLTTALTKEHILLDESFNFRKLTPIECERLQTVPEGYTEGVSDTQRYKMLGNGWTVDVIAHILSNIKYVQ
jgi:DNA (cytosine-5)-methyltransferase 3A